MATSYLEDISSPQARLTQPWVGGRQFFTEGQSYFRKKGLGYHPDVLTGAHAPLRLLRRHPTGAASMESLESDTTTYRSVLGDWGRPTRAGRP